MADFDTGIDDAAKRGLTVDAASEAALRAAVRALESVADPDPRLTGLLGSMNAVLHPTDSQGRLAKTEDREGRVAEALQKSQELAADPDVPESIRKTAAETARSLQITELARHNPRGARMWEDLHGTAA
jgi:hypothetical protein